MALHEGQPNPMVQQWVFITGASKPSEEMAAVAAATARNIIREGGAIAVGASPGVDLLTIRAALEEDPTAQRIRVFLPMPTEVFNMYRLAKAETRVERQEVADVLIRLASINPKAIIVPNPITPVELIEKTETERQVVYDSLNPQMANYCLDNQRRAIKPAISIYFGEGRGTQAAVGQVRGLLQNRVFNGMLPDQNPYHSNRPR